MKAKSDIGKSGFINHATCRSMARQGRWKASLIVSDNMNGGFRAQLWPCYGQPMLEKSTGPENPCHRTRPEDYYPLGQRQVLLQPSHHAIPLFLSRPRGRFAHISVTNHRHRDPITQKTCQNIRYHSRVHHFKRRYFIIGYSAMQS